MKYLTGGTPLCVTTYGVLAVGADLLFRRAESSSVCPFYLLPDSGHIRRTPLQFYESSTAFILGQLSRGEGFLFAVIEKIIKGSGGLDE